VTIKTVWTVQHACDHEEEHDLSGKRSSERAGYARWLSSKECSICWRASSANETGTDNGAWLSERRAEEAVAIATWQVRAAMGELEGSDKSAPWGTRVRHQLMSAAHDHATTCGMSDDEFTDRFELPARTITSASWWIDQRDTDPSDMEELLVDVSSSATSPVNQNPY
jgi:hypothetical protein